MEWRGVGLRGYIELTASAGAEDDFCFCNWSLMVVTRSRGEVSDDGEDVASMDVI